MATPLISPIKTQGGTFYTFPSAAEDFNFSQSSSNKEMRFSKFVLLDLPNIKSGSSGINVTGIEHIPSSYLKIDSNSPNNAFIESLQNYAMNFETLLTSKEEYDSTKAKTVSERIFWKWLKEMGTVRFREALVGNPENGGERTRRTEDNLTISTVTTRAEIGKRFVEEDASEVQSGDKYPYSQVVKYIGNIDSVNSTKYLGSAYTQIYMYIPTDCGKTPKVLFKSITDDSNYTKDMILTHTPGNQLNTEYIVGREYNATHPVGLDLRAHYDSDNNTFTAGTPGVDAYSLSIKKPGENSYTNGWWYLSPNGNSYYTEPNTLQDFKNDWMRITGHRSSVSNNKEFLRSRLDGIEIDFNLATSYSANLSGKYKRWEDFNRSETSTDFEFNAILIYYDLVDKTDATKTVTNLYGVYFIDNWEDTLTDGYQIPRAKKFKPSSVTRQTGNALAYELNLRLDLNANDTAPVSYVNEYSNVSMHLYMQALQSMRETHNRLLEEISAINILTNKVDALEDLFLNSVTLEDLSTRIATIENSLTESSALISDTEAIVKLIDRAYTEITNIYKNYTSVEMTYNLDLLQPGRGISFDRTVPGQLKLNTLNEGYVLGNKPVINWSDFQQNTEKNNFYYVHSLTSGHNWLKVYYNMVDSHTLNLINSEHLAFYIDDSSIKWKSGQSIKVSFGQSFIFNSNLSKAIVFYTDALNETKNSKGNYSVEIGFLTPAEVEVANGLPILEIICIDPINKIFEIDKIK